jgi:iron complex outermembrane receptor protein
MKPTRTVPLPTTRRNLLSLAIALALPVGAATAQDTTEAPQTSNAARLDAITVTAQRREEDPQKIPISMTVLAPEKIDILGSGGEDIRFLSGRVPSLNIESSFGRAFPRFYIRGLGNTDFDLNASQPVSLVYDDVVLENPILKGFPVFDLDRIEVLRGPQGTLFGRNTPAGVVKFDSAKPTQDFDAYGQVSYGRFNTTNFEGAVGGGLGGGWSARASAMFQHRDDWVDNTFTGEKDALEGYDEFATRLQLRYEGDGFDALFNVHYRDLDGTARVFRANIIEQGTNNLVPGFERDEVSIDGLNSQKLENFGASARLSWDLGRVTVFSITGYEDVEVLSRGDIDGGFGAAFLGSFGPGFIPFDAQSADGLPKHEQFTQEIRFQSNDWGRFDWQGGFFFFQEDITVDSFNFDTFGPGQPINGFARQKQDNTAWAVFASGDYDLTDRLNLRAGLRYTDDDKDFVAERTQSPLSFLGVGPIGPIEADVSDTDVSWDVSLSYAMSQDTNVFAKVARGFRAPSIQGRLLFGDIVSTAKSETIVSYEVGFKMELFDNRARLNATGYVFNTDDHQLTAVGGATNFNTLINADEVKGKGFEVDAEALVTDNLFVTFGMSWNNTEINDSNLATQVCGSGLCTVLDPMIPGTDLALIDGNPLPQAPEWVYNLTARYSVPLDNGAELYFYTDWYYRTEINFFLYESREFTGDPLLEGGLRAGYLWNNGQYEVAAFGRNILNEVEAVGGIDFNNLTGFVNEPSIWGVEFTARF